MESKLFDASLETPGNILKTPLFNAGSPLAKNSSKSYLGNSPEKKAEINQELYLSVLGNTNDKLFPFKSFDEPQTFCSLTGLTSDSRNLDGKPRSVLFPSQDTDESLKGILFSTTLENKVQVWDIETFSSIQSIPFEVERDKNEKISLPEDMVIFLKFIYSVGFLQIAW